jgi:hypothetical protein
MSTLNWRCCAKLSRFKSEVEILVRHKVNKTSLIGFAWYYPNTNNSDITYHNPSYFDRKISIKDRKDYEFVTLGEL